MFERAGKYNFVFVPLTRMSVTILTIESSYSRGKPVGTCLHRVKNCHVSC